MTIVNSNISPLSASSPTRPMSLRDRIANSFGAEFAEAVATRKSSTERSGANNPSWYGQFGEMTAFVPAQHRDPSFKLPELPGNPDKRHIRNFMLNTTLTGRDLASAWQAERPTLLKNKIEWRAEMKAIKQQLDNNFLALPQNVRDAAIASRNASI
jgi:hypothetical protein